MGADFILAAGDGGSTLQETVTNASGAAIACTGASLYLRHMATATEVGPLVMSVGGAGSNVLSYQFDGDELVDGDSSPLLGGWWYQIRATSGGETVTIPNDRGAWKMLDHAETIA